MDSVVAAAAASPLGPELRTPNDPLYRTEAGLTKTEGEVWHSVVIEGLTNKQIADSRHRHESTIGKTVWAVRRKLEGRIGKQSSRTPHVRFHFLYMLYLSNL